MCAPLFYKAYHTLHRIGDLTLATTATTAPILSACCPVLTSLTSQFFLKWQLLLSFPVQSILNPEPYLILAINRSAEADIN